MLGHMAQSLGCRRRCSAALRNAPESDRYAAVNSYTQSLARWREIATTDLVQLMQARFKRLLLDFEMTYSDEQISHPGERGRLLEETLKSFLTSVLPNRTGVGSGQVVAALERTK